MISEIRREIRKAYNAAANARHYALINRYSFIGPVYVGAFSIYFLLLIFNILALSIDLKHVFEDGELSRTTSRNAATNAGYMALVNASAVYPILLRETRLQKQIHKLFGFIVILMCTFHCVVKLLERPVMNTQQELHTTILIICLFLFALIKIIKHFSYECFILSHRAVGILCAYSTVCHVYAADSIMKIPLIVYLGTISMIFVSLFVFSIYKNSNSGMILPRGVIREAKGLHGVVQLTVHIPRHTSVKPGQYIKLWIPRVELLSVHSFMIAKSQWDREAKARKMVLTVFVQGRNGFSKKLLDMCGQSIAKQRLCLFFGPFGAIKTLKKTGTIVMVVSGLGFWSVHNYIEQIVRLGSDGVVTTRIILVWSTKCISPQELDAINRLIWLDNDHMLEHVLIFDESAKSRQSISHGRITVLSSNRFPIHSKSKSTIDTAQALSLEELVNDPIRFAQQANGGTNNQSYFDEEDELDLSTAIIISAELNIKDRIKEVVAKSTRSIGIHELEYTPYESPIANGSSPFDISIQSETVTKTKNHSA